MAGAGVKLFVSGEVAYAAEVNQYLMDQSIMRFTNRSTRAAAFGDGYPTTQTNPSTGNPGTGKPALAIGMFSYLLDNSEGSDGTGIGEAQFYDGTEWVGASNFAVADGSITTVKLADDAVTGDKIADNSITSAHIAAGTVVASDIADGTVTEAKLGSGAVTEAKLGSGSVTETKLGSNAVTSAKIATSVAGSGLAGGGGTALSVNVDDSTIEISSDTLRLKDSGITSAKLGSDLDLNGTTEIDEIIETVVINATGLTGTVNIDAKSGAVHYFTSNSAANWVWNFRGDGSTTLNSMLDTGQSITFALFATNSTAYKPTSLTVDTTGTVSVKWFGGNSYPSGNANSIDCYTITIVKTNANTYTAFASQSKFA